MLQLSPPPRSADHPVLWLQWPTLQEPTEPVPATSPPAVQPATTTTRRPRTPPPPARVPDAAAQAITAPAIAADRAPATDAAAPWASSGVTVTAAAAAPASAASAPPLQLRLEGPAGRALAQASRSDVQTLAQRSDTPLELGRVGRNERLANAIAETAMPSCTDPVPGGLLGIPILLFRPLVGRCK